MSPREQDVVLRILIAVVIAIIERVWRAVLEENRQQEEEFKRPKS